MASRAYSSGKFAMTIGGTPVGFVNAVQGGEPYGEVVAEPPAAGQVDRYVRKHLGALAHEPIVVDVGLETAVAPPLFEWINASLDGQAARRDGSISLLDYRMEERSRLEWTSGTITEVSFPAADASSKDAVTMQVTIESEMSRIVAGSGSFGSRLSQRQKAALASNFRFALSGNPTGLNRVIKVAPIEVVHRPGSETVGELREYGDSAITDVGAVAIWLPVTELSALSSWFDDFVLAGHNDASQERTGSLAFLDPSRQQELLRIDLAGLGIFRISHERVESGAEAIARAKVEFYCESAHLSAPASAPASSPEVSDTDPAPVAPLARPPVDVVRRPPAAALPSIDALATRLLASVQPAALAGDGEIGRAAGRAWATDHARLDELQAVAALADRHDWQALALGEGHTLAALLAGRGDLTPGETGPIDLARDDFTSGIVSGAAEIYRAVAPSLGERHPRG